MKSILLGFAFALLPTASSYDHVKRDLGCDLPGYHGGTYKIATVNVVGLDECLSKCKETSTCLSVQLETKKAAKG